MNNTDIQSRIDRLTEKQIECLRLVPFKNSKEIALALGINHHSVDARLKNAMRTLDVTSRKEAAMLLAEHLHNGQNNDQTYQPLVSNASDIPYPAPSDRMPLSVGEQSPAIDNGRMSLREDQAFYHGFDIPKQDHSPLSAALNGVRGENRLSIGERLYAILKITVYSLIGLATLVVSLDYISRLMAS